MINLKNNKEYYINIKDADTYLALALQLEHEKNYEKAKEVFKKVGSLCFCAYHLTDDAKLKNIAYKKFKNAESYFYEMDYRKAPVACK